MSDSKSDPPILRLLMIELAILYFFVAAGRFHFLFLGSSLTLGYHGYKLFPILFLTWLLWRWKSREIQPLNHQSILPLAVFTGVAFLSCFTSSDMEQSLKEWFPLAFYLGFFAMLLTIPWNRSNVQLVSNGFVFGNLYLGAVILQEFFNKPASAGIPKMNATYLNSEALGVYAVISLPLLSWICFQAKSGFHRSWSGIAIAGVVLAGLVSHSRTTMIALSIGSVVFLYYGFPSRRLWIQRGLLFLLLIAILATPQILYALLDDLNIQDPKITQRRFHTWIVYLNQVLVDVPLWGYGLGETADSLMYKTLISQEFDVPLLPPQRTPSAILQIFLAMGLLGFLAVLYMIRNLRHEIQRCQPEYQAIIASGLTAYMVCLLFDSIWLEGNIPIVMLTYMAMTSILSNQRTLNTSNNHHNHE